MTAVGLEVPRSGVARSLDEVNAIGHELGPGSTSKSSPTRTGPSPPR